MHAQTNKKKKKKNWAPFSNILVLTSMLVTAHEVEMASWKLPADTAERGLTTDSLLERGLSKPESMLLSELLLFRLLVRESSIGAL